MVQRLATDSIAQPGAAVRSAIVPDLTTALVDQIQAANTAVLRQQALDALLASLQASGAVDDPDRTEIRYVHQNNANAAVTRVTGMEDDDPIRITVYRNGYDAGPAALYSTVRHELIHVAQRLLVPDEDNAQFDDSYMHENIYDQDVGVATRDTIQIPLQEIETHAWELIHAGETGVNAAYSQQTVTDLVAYAQTLTDSVQAVELNTFIYWHDYLAKAVILLVDANAAHDSLLIRNAADALAAAVEARSDEAAEE